MLPVSAEARLWCVLTHRRREEKVSGQWPATWPVMFIPDLSFCLSVSSLFSYSLMDQLPYSSFIPGSRSSPETCYYHGRRRKKQEGWCSLPCLLRFLFSIGICHFCSDFIGQGGPWSSLLSVRQGILLLLQRSTAVGDNGERDLILLQAR